ncbi:hypothetical protein K450DRAFT_246204 [Umbelopsis ramanniana AG]|uniref:Alpha/beta hydrolase fold-3 domain-containing protein n=1 Tax=Umbelopsis ramanniana AG TaxID=1314678 RepID=A0AAD5E7V7_UMBRA|nr:uncharacterized protein K450DRAFT_246204 [Umbelopsis ramanniana AG]KAI8578527.1 hypothetical protein K450DRAFT_246204 [Umbelopsis ramanniana AG]
MSWNNESIEALCKLNGVEFRETVNKSFAKMLQDTEPEVVLQPASVTNTKFKGPKSDIPIRIYTPDSDGCVKLPAVVFYRGGGFINGGLDSHDSTCRRLCVKSGAVIISVDYRVAPEHPFPAAVDDCYAALQYVHQNADALNIDASRVAVAGDSSGGTLTAVVTIMARDNNGPSIKFQCLIYPPTDFTTDYSKHQPHEGALLRRETINLQDNYLQDYNHREDIRVSPLKADLTGLPSAWVFVAEYDPLTPESIAYVEKLQSQSVSVELVTAPGADHGIFTFPSNLSPDTVRYQEAAAAAIKKALS